MSQSSLMTASLDDIVFEGRNQAYGAYQLRQDYKGHLASAGGITAGLCALLLLSWVAWQRLAPAAVVATEPVNPVKVAPQLIDLTKPKQAVLAPPKAAHVLPTHPPVPATPTIVAKDNLVPPAPTPKPLPPLAEVDGLAGPATAGPATSPGEIGPAAEGGGDGGDGGPATAAAPAVAGPYIVVEKMPEFAGGQAALLRYLQKNLRYPSRALASQIEGRVFLSFVVQADGTIADITILKGLGYGLDEEAERVVRQMPAWTPGYQSHHAVPVRFTLPLTFKIQ